MSSTRPRAWVFVLPWVAGLGVFVLYPFLASLRYSFTDYSVLQPPVPIGLDNYRELAEDRIFWIALKNTLLYAAMAIPAGLAAALLLAKALNTPATSRPVFRAIVYLPHLVPTVASSILWMWMLNPDNGLLTSLLNPVLDWIGWKGPSFLSDAKLLGMDFGKRQVIFGALPSLALMGLWGVGQMAIVYLARLQEVPQELYEAAALDGAGAWAVFRHVELPQLSPIILFSTILGIIGAFQIFAEPYIVTGGTGGPDNATYLLPMFIYDYAFEYMRMGYACAAAWILFGIIAALTLLAFRAARGRVYYAGN